jgi:hypothetical protein
MEAIAHSPSFAKKVHIPQSVGKDYAAADKGKTFSKGGEMKESKGMVGKEMAFMKKKGAPKSMIKHEEAEMKGMKRGGKVRRMAGGGMGDPFERDTDYEAEKAQGAKNLEGIKSFFGFGKKKEEETRPMDKPQSGNRSKPPSWSGSGDSDAVKPQKVMPTPRVELPNPESDNSKKESGPQYTSNVNQGAADFNYESQSGSKVGSGASGFNQTPYEDSGFSALSKKPPVKRAKPVTVSETKETKSVTAAPSDTSYASMEERRALNKKPATKRSFGTANLTDEERAANREAVSGFFGKIGKGLKDMYNMETPAERRSRERKIKEEETHMAKGGKVKKMRYGGDTGMDMGQPMRGTPMGSPQMPMEDIERRKAKMAGMPNAAAAMGAAAVAKMRARTGMGFDEGQGYGNRGPQPQLMQAPELPPERAPTPIERMPYQEPERQMPKMPDGEMVKTATATSAPRPEIGPRGIKAGGQVKKMAQGGYAKADGAASRGKTQPKMVKMAKGGFVKTADGCAQRGKTKAFQVKMKNGGMC